MSIRNSPEAKARRRLEAARKQVEHDSQVTTVERRRQALESATRTSHFGQAVWGVIGFLRITTISPSPHLPAFMASYSWVLLLLAVVAQIQIYWPLIRGGPREFEKKHKLITTGFFRYTRHPMYTLVLIWDTTAHVLYQPMTAHIVMTTIGFWMITLYTCYLHEQEVLAKFGKPAELYYARTPRLFFMYPLVWFVRR